ncbi:peptidoglycan DD-metalloendopeptidase family protein [Frigoribacterium sp. R86507]|uniref:peptidoglycan DD-metalloendopeptidase family protein n=1 Tax=Frigoribacterium sp. R86507 TaxID=3093850 RepID=UPI0037C8A3A0
MTSPVTLPRRQGAAAAVATVLLSLTLVVSGTVLGASPAQAASYPSWDDVQAARSSESAKASEVSRIQGLLDQLASDATTAQAEAERLGAEFEQAQADADAGAAKLAELQSQADEKAAVADASEQRAGQVSAQLARTGGGNVSSQLVGDTEQADDLLYRLGAMSKLTEQTDGIRQQAVNDRNVAQSLSDQAKVASDALVKLQGAAQVSMDEAQAASDAAAAAVAAQQENESRLQGQLAVLQDQSLQTEADYATGVEVARQAEEARKAAAAAEAARQAEALRQQRAAAAAAAAARPSTPSAPAPAPSTGGGSSGGGGASTGSGWVRPSAGYMSSGYGMRVNPVTGVYRMHDGIDLAPGCNSPIYAATSGTVTFAGQASGYGNYIQVSHGGGVSTAYGHIVNGGIKVSRGQSVVAGQLIALVGSTGNSTGCHLHFETRVGGASTNPVPFMSARGVRL